MASSPKAGAHSDQGPLMPAMVGMSSPWKLVPSPPCEQTLGMCVSSGMPTPLSTAVFGSLRRLTASTEALTSTGLSSGADQANSSGSPVNSRRPSGSPSMGRISLVPRCSGAITKATVPSS